MKNKCYNIIQPLQTFRFSTKLILMIIVQAETDEQISDSRLLFREYEAWFGMDLCFQGFEREVAELPENVLSRTGDFSSPIRMTN